MYKVRITPGEFDGIIIDNSDKEYYLEKDGKIITGSTDFPLIKDAYVQCSNGSPGPRSDWCSATALDSDELIFDLSKVSSNARFSDASYLHGLDYLESRIPYKDGVYTANYKFKPDHTVVSNDGNITIDKSRSDYEETNGRCTRILTCAYSPLTPEAMDKLFKVANITQYKDDDVVPDYTNVDNWGPVALVSFIMISSTGFVGAVSWMAITRFMDRTNSVAGMHGITTRIL